MLLLWLAVLSMMSEPVQGLEPLLEPGSVLLLGEIHGTVESPAFASLAVRAALDTSHPVTVALEIPREETVRIAAYLQSEGKSNDRTALLAGAFWIDPFQDGRRSKAMLALIEDLRVLIKRGKRVHVTLLDDPGAISANRDRDVIMADNLQTAFELSPTDVFIVLTGNAHSRITGRSMGQLFARGMPALKVTALDVA